MSMIMKSISITISVVLSFISLTDWTCLSTYNHTAAAIAIHNFPEGIATFIVGLATPQLGIALAIAIAVHNIPEGIIAN